MQIDLVRHGHKNNAPEAHQSGVEALLEPAKIPLIIEFAQRILRTTDPQATPMITVRTTPIDRSRATGGIFYNHIRRGPFYVTPPIVDEFLGSCSRDPQTRLPVNLSPVRMSQLWAEAKKCDDYSRYEGEHRPLFAWFSQGLDNPQACCADDPGISLREIAWRISAFIGDEIGSEEGARRIVAFGHSGDIEPWLALTLQIQRGRDDGMRGTAPADMVEIFDEIHGALEPLTGIHIEVQPNTLYLSGPPLGEDSLTIPREIIQRQADLLRCAGRSQEVVRAKCGQW